LDSADDKKHEILAKILRNENPQDTKAKGGAKDKKGYDDGLDQKDSKNKNPIYKDKKIYGFMFIYDVTQYESLAKVYRKLNFLIRKTPRSWNLLIIFKI